MRGLSRNLLVRLRLGATMALALGMMTGCASFLDRYTDNLSTAVMAHDDPETVRDAAPAYLLLVDSLVVGDPDSVSHLSSGARLYAAYATLFAGEPKRARRLSSRALEYGQRAACIRVEALCPDDRQDFESFRLAVTAVDDEDHQRAVYSYAVAWLAWINAHSDDWSAIADLPRAEALLERCATIDPAYDHGNLQLYLGRIKTLRPPALGGEPEAGRAHFERAIELSDGRNLAAKLEFARSYARMMQDRELHDRLLREVLEADPKAGDYTLMNVLAQEQAERLLAESEEYFF